MTLEEVNTFLVKAFQDISGQEPKFDECSGTNGWSAVVRGSNEFLGYEMRMLRRWSEEDYKTLKGNNFKYHKVPATGRIQSLGLKTQIPFKGKSNVEVNTKIKYLDDKHNVTDVQERIEDAIKTQKAAREILDNKEDAIKNAYYYSLLLGAYSSQNPIQQNKTNFSIMFPNYKDNPAAKLVSSHHTDFEASAMDIDDLPKIDVPLGYQIECFEAAIL
jgi:hypothetical protein